MLAKTQIFWSFLIGIALSRAQSENDIAEEIKQKLRKWSATIINCPCVKISECPLVKDDQVKSLNANHPVRREWVTFFRDRICDKVKRTVMCCSEEEMTRNSGTWKPKGELGECGLDTSAPSNVIGGRFAKMGEFPYMVLLGYNRNGSIYYNCGASVINKWYIITAGHCVTSEFGAPAEIVLGEHTLGTDPDCMTVRGRIIGCRNPIIKRKVAEVILHPNYNVSERLSPHDIALIRVDEIIPFYAEENSKSSVLPICLPWNSEDPGRNLQQGDRLTITGWGKITNNARVNLNSLLKYQASARKLSKAKIPGVAIRKCQKENLYKNRLDPKVQLCAGGEEGVDSCGGDSGGPLAYKQSTDSPWYQVGIVSYGTRYCGQGTPGVYTRVSAFLAWIESNMKE